MRDISMVSTRSIAMMSVGDFIAAEFQCLIVQRTLAHFGT